MESIPSKRYPEILDYVRTAPIRPGLVELLDFLDAEGVPFVVVSGGLQGMVETVLGELVQRVCGIYAMNVDTSAPELRVHSDFEDGTELVSKVQVMQQFAADEAIAIGDSVTDLNMALQASVVFARDRLVQYLDERQKPHIPWNDFFDVRDHLIQQWKLN